MMMNRQNLLLAIFLCISGIVFAQKEKKVIRLHSGVVYTTPNIFSDSIEHFNRKAFHQGTAFVIIQFEVIPSEQVKRELASNGIILLDYIPDNAYTVTIKQKLNQEVLKRAKARAFYILTPQQKMHPSLVPKIRTDSKSLVKLQIRFLQSFTSEEVVAALSSLNYTITSKDLLLYHTLTVQTRVDQLTKLAALPFIEYLQEEHSQIIPLNQTSRLLSSSTALNASIANGGKGLNGEGVVIGVGDDGNAQGHIDFGNRVIAKTTTNSPGHGVHVAGTIGSAGNKNELNKGYASKATILSAQSTDVWWYAADHVQDHDMVLANNSYQIVAQTCAASGIYDIYSAMLDQQASLYPFLQQVFASGNHGHFTCSPYSSGFGTIAGSLQCAKNVLTVGATDKSGAIGWFSSTGPVRDGRIKPEIVAFGVDVVSTKVDGDYETRTGTSQAAPAVTGGAALLYERYRQLNGNANPPNALVKALLCNGATDKGNAGPDYRFGFGSLNLLRSIDMLEKGRFINGSMANGGMQSSAISVPANTAQLKVMIYWNDPASSSISSKALVNDLDLEVTDHSATTVLPLVLDPTPANVNKASTQGVDHLNNIEQVVINNPTAGTYTISVKGTAIAMGPTQDYVIVYDIIPTSLELTHPVGGEGLLPGKAVQVQWQSFGGPANTFQLEYSLDNGSTWTVINNAIGATANSYTWTTPAIGTEKAMVRISKNGTALNSSSKTFTIIGKPTISLSTMQCPSYIAIEWPAIANATDYEIMIVKGGEMFSVGTTTGTTYTLNSLSPDNIYWVSVRARVNGQPGERSLAISRQPNSGTCVGSISDGDLKMEAILSPASGRKATSSSLTTATEVKVQVRNLDDVAINNFSVKYSIDGGTTWVTEAGLASVPAQGVYEHTFSAKANMAALANYTLVAAVVNNDTDPVASNNTLSQIIKHLDNQPLDLSTHYFEGFESAALSGYTKDTIGLTGIDRYDFENSTANGRLRTFVSHSMNAAGTRAITLDVDRALAAPGNINYLIGTFNMSNYTTANDIRLNFNYNQHSQPPNAANRVWIRGNDNSATPWIEAYNLDNNSSPAGIYKTVTSIELSDLLATYSQTYSSSFQIKWGQEGANQAVDRELSSGYTIDDVRIYQALNDMQAVSIDGFPPVSCGLSSATPITVSVRNTVNTTLTNIPIRYRVNGSGLWVTETMASIAGNTTASFTFATKANLSSYGTYLIEVVVDLAGDSFADNNSTQLTFLHTPLITTFPHLQDFEASNGNWYTTGIGSSWAWGTPASININKAASGTKAWKTNLAGLYNNNEHSFLYSPCYDLSGLTNPMLSFSIALDIENCGTTTCDAARVEYSTDGITWKILGTSGAGTNWYNRPAPQQFWSIENFTRWHVASIPLPVGSSRLRLRFVFASDLGLAKEGIAIDDIHIYDKPYGIYTGTTTATPIQQNISGGTDWVHFTQGSGLIASIQPKNQNLGATDVQAYLYAGAVRNINNQYYANRNITIKPTTTNPSDPVTIRLYFTEAEVVALTEATGCTGCTKPKSAYELGVSKMSHTDKTKENDQVSDGMGGKWSFIPSEAIRVVPYDDGYYAEFNVTSFSEFWFSDGGIDGFTALPVNLISFAVQRKEKDVLLKWEVTETNILKYEVEVAQENPSQFTTIGEVNSRGNNTHLQQYSFIDVEADKLGTRFYRLKVIEQDGSYTYSPIRRVVFANPLTWQVYPNPSNGVFYLIYQLNPAEKLNAQVFDSRGRLVQQYNKEGNGGWQKFAIDLSANSFPTGVYLLRITTNEKLQSFRINKQ